MTYFLLKVEIKITITSDGCFCLCLGSLIQNLKLYPSLIFYMEAVVNHLSNQIEPVFMWLKRCISWRGKKSNPVRYWWMTNNSFADNGPFKPCLVTKHQLNFSASSSFWRKCVHIWYRYTSGTASFWKVYNKVRNHESKLYTMAPA